MEKRRNKKIFIADDDIFFTNMLSMIIKDKYNYDIYTFPTGEEMMLEMNQRPDAIILDYHLDSIVETASSGAEIFEMIKKKYPDIPVIILSSQKDIEKAVNLVRMGATDYVVKNENLKKNLDTSLQYAMEVSSFKYKLNDLLRQKEALSLRFYLTIGFLLLTLITVILI